MMRIKVLAKSGHTDIRLADLEGSFDKLDAASRLLSMDEFSDAIAQATITEYIIENTKATKTAPAKAPDKAVKTPQVKAIKGMTPLGVKAPAVAENEDAPF